MIKIIVLLFSSLSFSLPVLDASAASNTMLTIYPDHKDLDLFYAVPKSLEIAIDENTKKPLFSYHESKDHCRWIHPRCKPKATIRVLLRPKYDKLMLEHIRPSLLKLSQNPLIVGAPYSFSYLKLENSFDEIDKEKSFCEHKAGQAGTFQACVIHLTEKGVELHRRSLMDAMSLVVHLEYKIKGVVQNIELGYENFEIDTGVSGTIGSSILKYHPDLFLDHKGRVIEEI